MEIVLIIVLILIILIFQSGQNTKAGEVLTALKKIEQHLSKMQSNTASLLEQEKLKAQRDKYKPSESYYAKNVVIEKVPEKKPEPKVEPKPEIKPETIEPVKEPVKEPVIEPEKKPEIEEVIIPPVPESIPEPVIEEPKNIIFENPPEQVISDEELTRLAMAEKLEDAPEPVKPVVPPVKTEYIRPRVEPIKRTEPPKPPEDDWYTKFRKQNPDLEKFIGENILSKVAITILVLGIAFFVKFAIDKDWINEVARVGIGVLAGGIVLAFAHRLRIQFKAFSSVLVAGGISIFYFTIGIGFHEYHVFSQTVAFALMLLITTFSVFISVAYDRIELAVLSIIGGFGTPFMVSTGSGNYQVLFTYILILDVGMLVLAYMRKWNLVNILTYFFTILLYISWLQTRVINKHDAPYMGALLFGAAFYIIFILMNIVNNVKSKRQFAVMEISILLSNTFIYYACGMQILYYFHPEWKGVFSISMAIVNMICAWLLYKKYKADTRLVYMMIGLTLTFVTISVPVQLEGNYITLVWAVESVLLMWLAVRSNIGIYRFSSILLFILMMFSLFLDWDNIYNNRFEEDFTRYVILNKGFITGLVCAITIITTSYLLKAEIKKTGNPDMTITWYGMSFHPGDYSAFLKVLFVALLYIIGILELSYQLHERLTVSLAYYILMMCYHLLFVCGMNLVFSKNSNSYLQNTILHLNIGSLVLFVIGFAWLPIEDFKENIIRLQTEYIGFIFHYVSLAAVVYLAIRVYRVRMNDPKKQVSKPMIFTVLIASAIIYVCSVELLLHVAQLRMHNVATATHGEVIRVLTQFETVTRHVIKAGFPILWGLLAFAFLSFGMKKHVKSFRIVALLLIAITVFKLFLYDIRSSSEGGKILAFIILGVVLLIISFMYQKIKALIIEGRPDDKNNTSV